MCLWVNAIEEQYQASNVSVQSDHVKSHFQYVSMNIQLNDGSSSIIEYKSNSTAFSYCKPKQV